MASRLHKNVQIPFCRRNTIIGRLEDFTLKVKNGLDQADWDSKRDIIRALVKRVEVEKGQVNVVFRVDQLPFESSPARGSLQHCGRRSFAGTDEYDTRRIGNGPSEKVPN